MSTQSPPQKRQHTPSGVSHKVVLGWKRCAADKCHCCISHIRADLFSPLPVSPASVELLCCADRELICLPHLSPPPRGPRVRRRRRAPVKRLLCLLLAASPPLRSCADSASLSLLSGALSKEPVSGRRRRRRSEGRCACE